MEQTKLRLGNRIGALFIDQIIFFFLISFLYTPAYILFFLSRPDLAIGFNFFFLKNLQIGIAVISIMLMLNKDFFGGISPAKLLLKFQVLNNKTGQVASPLRCMLRNLTFLLAPVELIFVLIRPERRLGDYIAGTRIAVYEPERERESSVKKHYYYGFFAALILAFVFVSIVRTGIRAPYETPAPNTRSEKRHLAKNDDMAAELENILKDKLQMYTKFVDVRIIGSKNVRAIQEVSLGFLCPDLLVADVYSPELDNIEDQIEAAVRDKIRKNPYIIRVNIVNKQFGYPMKVCLDYTYTLNGCRWFRSASGHYGGTRIYRDYYSDGVLSTEEILSGSLRCGTSREWYRNGLVRQEDEYMNGMQNGLSVKWHENGKKYSESIYKNGFFVEQRGRWNKNGKKLKNRDYDY